MYLKPWGVYGVRREKRWAGMKPLKLYYWGSWGMEEGWIKEMEKKASGTKRNQESVGSCKPSGKIFSKRKDWSTISSNVKTENCTLDLILNISITKVNGNRELTKSCLEWVRENRRSRTRDSDLTWCFGICFSQ